MVLNSTQRASLTPVAARRRADAAREPLELAVRAGEPRPSEAWMAIADTVYVMTQSGGRGRVLKSRDGEQSHNQRMY